MNHQHSPSNPLTKFFLAGPGPGLLLIFCVIISLFIANSPLNSGFEEILNFKFGFHSESIHLKYTTLTWINDGLMAIFFLLVGLEIKKELVEGELATPKKAILPIFGALGGVIFPALLFTLFNFGLPTLKGWATPMATDIAFALAIVSILGDKVPTSLKVFLAALAIVDDLMAIIVIALFYATALNFLYLGIAAAITAGMVIFNRIGVKNLAFYLIPGLLIWYFIHHSGIHATIAGVITAFCIPLHHKSGSSPLEDLVAAISHPVNLVIMPIFALVNTNITFMDGMIEGLTSPLSYGIIIGLVIGKPLGITLFSIISIKTGICTAPEKASLSHMIGVGMLAGIGFTMSIFIAVLSFSGNPLLLGESKFAILLASITSAIVGSVYLSYLHKKRNV